VLVVGLCVLLLGGIWGGSVSKLLSSGGYYDPSSESVRAADVITHALGVPASDATVLFVAGDDITAPGPSAAVVAALQALPPSAVKGYVSYWTSHLPQLISTDRHATYVTLQLVGTTDAAQETSLASVKAALRASALPGISSEYGGTVPLNQEISGQVGVDLKRAELLSLPIVAILLVLIFGSLVSAGLPVAVGICGILGAFSVLRVLTSFVHVSIFALNLVTILGLGLGVDYALFMVSRFREEIARQVAAAPSETAPLDVRHAVVRTMATAGRTVAFSGVTIAASMASLILFPETFLRSMGYGGVAVVLVDVVAALTVLPALLAVLGRRVDALRVPLLGRHKSIEQEAHHGGWYRLAHSVMRRPLLYVVTIVIVLTTMALPFTHVTFGGYTANVLPKASQGRIVTETLARDFPGNSTVPIHVVVENVSDPASVGGYVTALGAVKGAVGAHVVVVKGRNALIDVGFIGDPVSHDARATLTAIRGVAPPAGSTVLLGGLTAFLVDQLHSIGHVLPWMLGVMVIAMLVLLFLAFGSVVLPVKAVIMNAMSIGASFGAVTWIFQGGHLANVLGFTKLGYLDATDPILMLAVIFGLSMDYEVFLLSRVREEWDESGRRGDPLSTRNENAVAVGLQRSGRIITSAALLLVVVIGAFATSRITTLKLLGVGMGLAIFVDATIVRALLVPAVMRLLGAANWWAPARVTRWWQSHGFVEPHDEETREVGQYETLVT